MDVAVERCAGLDVDKKTVTACAIVPDADGRPTKAVRRFGTMAVELEALAVWLAERAVAQVAMESAGAYWQPVWNILEEHGGFELVLANARRVKAVPGRKTGIRDSEWLAELLRHGLRRGSYGPDRAQRELRELARYRTALGEERTAHVNRLQEAPEPATIKLASVASDVTGVSARAMLAEPVGGDADPAALADLAVGRLRAKLPDPERALVGRVTDHHRSLVPRIPAAIDFLDGELADLDARVADLERPFADAVARLDGIPGVGRRVAEILVAEVGPAVDRFPSAEHPASWAGLCPGNHESAGKRLSGTTRKGSRALRRALRRALVQAAHAAGTARRCYLGARYHRRVARRGATRAAVAVAHAILVIAYHLLTRGTAYADLGPGYFARRDAAVTERRLVARLEQLGFDVTLSPRVA